MRFVFRVGIADPYRSAVADHCPGGDPVKLLRGGSYDNLRKRLAYARGRGTVDAPGALGGFRVVRVRRVT